MQERVQKERVQKRLDNHSKKLREVQGTRPAGPITFSSPRTYVLMPPPLRGAFDATDVCLGHGITNIFYVF